MHLLCDLLLSAGSKSASPHLLPTEKGAISSSEPLLLLLVFMSVHHSCFLLAGSGPRRIEVGQPQSDPTAALTVTSQTAPVPVQLDRTMLNVSSVLGAVLSGLGRP